MGIVWSRVLGRVRDYLRLCAGDTIWGKVFNTLFWGLGAIVIRPFAPQNTHQHLLWIWQVLLANVALYVLVFGSAGIVVRSLRPPR